MSLIASRSRTFLATAALGLLLGGCGLTQRTIDGGSSLANSIFYKQVTVLRLDLNGRPALNTASRDMSGLSVSTLVRVYQLKDREALDRADYSSLLSDSASVLASDLLGEHSIVLKPGEGAQLDVPMAKGAKFVAVVALFRAPDLQGDKWRLVLARTELDPNSSRVIEVSHNQLNLMPQPQKDTWW
ncbi:type VI secretion system lipoprotein TssJ [Pseudomonas mosselii]|uniref:type VI secretion system lipoprotein TssJ n=1 Tax=Pseudomonas mosselii TaxID=78327 RepID=UPI003F31BD17